ncbi:hypothetical protein DPMN_043976 [Dreissena polymorpha]|uniref:E3 UFM1-protein ligase 1-like N-terminal domain-containing protein n=1 Tax=Dreissena polymorpha TaxID=45954 RepID=A0A9D4D3A8_DREPO|nr:hypothetical protein DPMN_043976 [Dreissena polymorpha]
MHYAQFSQNTTHTHTVLPVCRSYLDRLAEEVNDTLQDKGHVTIPDLTKQYDLPAEFIAKVTMLTTGLSDNNANCLAERV